MVTRIKLLLILSIFVLIGCADVKTPTAHYALTHPFNTKTMVSRGTGKDEIIEKWGQPTEIIHMGHDDMGIEKQAWLYDAWFPGAPLDYRHFSRKKKIYFTGDYVTGFEDIEEAGQTDSE